MKNFEKFITERGYMPIFNGQKPISAWYKPGQDPRTNSAIYDQTYRKDKPSYDPEQAYLVATEVIHNNGKISTAWVHEDATEARLFDEIIVAEMLACDNIVNQKKIATDYLGEDLLTKHVSAVDLRSDGLRQYDLKKAFSKAAQEVRFAKTSDHEGAEVHGIKFLRGMFELDGVDNSYSRFRFKEAPVHIEVIRDPKGLGPRAPEAGYLVNYKPDEQEPVFIPADFSKVGYGCQVEDAFPKAILTASVLGLSHVAQCKSTWEAFNLLDRCFDLSVLEDSFASVRDCGGDLSKWKNLIEYGYRYEVGEELCSSQIDDAPTAPGP